MKKKERGMKRILRAKFDRKIAGVCGGLGSYFNIDPTIIRLIMLFFCVLTGIIPMVLAYLGAIFIIPEETKETPLSTNYKRLYRSTKDRKIAGICGGIAEMTKLDPVFLRLLTLFICLITAVLPLVFAYIVGWIIIPESED